MMKLRFYFMALLAFAILSCQGSKEDIDNIITKYDKEDFSCLQNAFINIRGGVNNDSIALLINKSGSKCSPYIVLVNNRTKEIISVDGKLPQRDCEGYFTNEEIESYVKCFFKYNFQVLSVDSQGNVFINPSQQNLPILLRTGKGTEPKDIKDFKPYKGDWYIRK